MAPLYFATKCVCELDLSRTATSREALSMIISNLTNRQTKDLRFIRLARSDIDTLHIEDYLELTRNFPDTHNDRFFYVFDATLDRDFPPSTTVAMVRDQRDL